MKTKMVGLRWHIATPLCLASAVYYLDRQTLSVLEQTIQEGLHTTTIQYAHITPAFLVNHTIR